MKRQTQYVADKLSITPRQARRKLKDRDPDAMRILKEADPVGLAVRLGVDGLLDAFDDNVFESVNIRLGLLKREGFMAGMTEEQVKAIATATKAFLAIQQAYWAAVKPWHELDRLTCGTGKLSDKASIEEP